MSRLIRNKRANKSLGKSLPLIIFRMEKYEKYYKTEIIYQDESLRCSDYEDIKVITNMAYGDMNQNFSIDKSVAIYSSQFFACASDIEGTMLYLRGKLREFDNLIITMTIPEVEEFFIPDMKMYRENTQLLDAKELGKLFKKIGYRLPKNDDNNKFLVVQ